MDRRALAWLLVLAMLGPVAVAATTAAQSDDTSLYETTDATGDVEFQSQGQGADAPPTTTQSTDLVAFRILDENAETMLMEVQVADMRAPDAATDSFEDPTAYIRFRVEGSAAYYHLFAFGITGGAFAGLEDDDPGYVNAYLCITNNADEPMPAYYFDLYQRCYLQPVPALTFPADDVVQILVPKLALLGVGGDGEARPGGIPKTIDAGQQLVDWRVQIQKRVEGLGFGFFIGGTSAGVFHDQMPDDGVAEAYTLKAPAANARVVLRAQGALGGVFTGVDTGIGWDDIYPVTYVGVPPSDTVAVPIDAYNGADTKRLVNLTARFPGDGADRFDIRLAPVVEVPAGETRSVNLLLNVTQPLSHRELVDLEVRGTSLGHDGEVGSALIRLVGNTPPTADSNTLRFHSIHDYGDAVEAGPGYTCIGGCNIRIAHWMNTLADDPLDEVGDGGVPSGFYLSFFNTLLGSDIVYVQFYRLDAPLTHDLHFDPGEPVTATLAFSSGIEFDATAHLRASGTLVHDDCPPDERCTERIFLGEGTAPITVGSDATTVELTFMVPSDLDVLSSAGGRLDVEILLESDDPRATATDASDETDIRFYPSQSRLTLPVAPDPDPDPVHDLFISLDAAGETEEFVNPGKTRAFHVHAINEGVDDTALRLTAQADLDGWSAGLQPADRYKLGPGESVNVTVLITAPAQAQEGDTAEVEIVATSVEDNSSSRPLTLRAIATDGIDIEDEGGPVEADEDTKKRILQDDGGDSPGLGTLVALVALAIVAAHHRRR